jgi:hypothetical protein
MTYAAEHPPVAKVGLASRPAWKLTDRVLIAPIWPRAFYGIAHNRLKPALDPLLGSLAKLLK